jgi:hypothetical protein
VGRSNHGRRNAAVGLVVSGLAREGGMEGGRERGREGGKRIKRGRQQGRS